MNNQSSLQNIAYTIIIIIGVGFLLHIGSSLILPMIYALFISVFLLPIDRKIRKLVKVRWLSILLSFISVAAPIFLITFIFSMQFIDIVDQLPSVSNSLKDGFTHVISRVDQAFPLLQINEKTVLNDTINSILDGPMNFLGTSLMSTTEILVSILITIIYIFFFLLYRRSFRKFIIHQFSRSNRPEIKSTISEIKDTIQSYVGGLGLVILILTVLNTLGLWIIGVNYPLFWGALAGLLAVIPYLGTGLGGLLPFLYSLATYDYSWQPVAVLIYYTIIQQIEGNIITPKIVGDKVDINPLFAIVSLLFFGMFWGVPGVILALPIISITRIVLSHFESTESLATIMSTNIATSYRDFED